jgi:hypothetical protein
LASFLGFRSGTFFTAFFFGLRIFNVLVLIVELGVIYCSSREHSNSQKQNGLLHRAASIGESETEINRAIIGAAGAILVRRHGSTKSPACSCISIKFPASS